MSDKIVFFSRMCLLDNSSGAAISVRSFLEALASSGMQCESFTASHFDPNREIDLAPILGRQVKDPDSLGKRLIIESGGMTHSVFLTKNTRSGNTTQEELQNFENAWKKWLHHNKPRIVITFGGSSYSVRLQKHAREAGAQIVFYLGNAEYDNAEFYSEGDIVLCPSEFLREHYKKTLGVKATVFRPILKPERLDEVSPASPEGILERKRKGFVTFMNPIPHKGLILFARIAQLALQKKPDLKFLVTEGRMSREWLAERNLDLGQFPNVWFIPNQRDVRSVYQRTSVLLMPSFWQEGLGRSVIEAQLSGIPVIASPRGGTPEALNGGGKLLDIPEACTENYMAMPDDEVVHNWWREIEVLIEDDDAYTAAAQRALSASRPFHPEITTAKAIEFFSDLLKSPRDD